MKTTASSALAATAFAALLCCVVLRPPGAEAAFAPGVGITVGRPAVAVAPAGPLRLPPSFFADTAGRCGAGAGVGALHMSSDDADEKPEQVGLDEYASKIQDNVLDGGAEFGSRGEAYVALQFGLLLCIASGGVPLIGDAVAAVVGPGLIAVGLAAVYSSASQMGTSLSPWPVPVKAKAEGGSMSREGAFGVVRHPMYAGLLAGMAGLSIMTDSATRLLLTAALAFAMNLKAEYEENKMREAFPDEYEEYMKEVPGRFLPDDLVTKVTDAVKQVAE